MTAYGRGKIMVQAEEESLDAFLFKPIKPSVLFDTIIEIFSKDADFPIKQEAQTTKDKEDTDLSSIKGAKILVVEDNDLNQQIAAEILEQAGFVVAVANNGKEALDMIIGKNIFNSVLMDIQMPEMDGYEASRRIRIWENENSITENETRQHIPIIAATAHALKDERQRCIDSGMDDYISKPIDPEQLFSVLKKWVAPILKAPLTSPRVLNESDQMIILPDGIAGLDISAGLKHMSGNKRLYRDLLKSFVIKYSGEANKIRKLIKSNDLHQAAIACHTLKGISANLGAFQISLHASELEKAIISEDIQQSLCSIDQLEKETDLASESINIWIESIKETDGLTADDIKNIRMSDIPEIKHLIKDLNEYLEQNNIAAINCFFGLKPLIYGSYTKEVSQLEQLINNLEFDKALELLPLLAKTIKEPMEAEK